MIKGRVLISIILPTYNRVGYIEESINSILNNCSDVDNFELIIVDDGSTDNTQDLVRSRYSNNSSIKLIQLQHTGKPSIARNAGLKEACGKYVAFQDSDDIWYDNPVAERLEVFKDEGVVLSYTNAAYIGATGKHILLKRLIQPHQVLVENTFTKLVSSHSAPVPTPTVIIRQDLINKIGLFDENLTYGEDTEYWIKASTAGRFVYNPRIGALIRRHGNNLSLLPSDAGKQAVYVHELSHISMFRNLIGSGILNEEQIEIIRYRMAELKQLINDLAIDLGKRKPFSNVPNVPRNKPAALKLVDKGYSKTMASRFDCILRFVFGRFPRLYKAIKSALKWVLSPLRRV